MARYRGRFGLPALTTFEALIVFLLMSALAFGLLLLAEHVFGVDLEDWAGLFVFGLPLLVVGATPKKLRDS